MKKVKRKLRKRTRPDDYTHVSHGNYETLFKTKDSGINANITIYASNPRSRFHHNDVRLLNENGGVIWEEHSAIRSNGVRTFWCGLDVYAIQVRAAAVNAVGEMFQPELGYYSYIIE